MGGSDENPPVRQNAQAFWTRSAATQPRRGDVGPKAEIINPSLTANTSRTAGLSGGFFVLPAYNPPKS